ncbi:MAG TPA: alpha/beta hydrolase [Myxococcales bacterium]|jgi:pimeloyl-ACP methyl ester carboxylesterase
MHLAILHEGRPALLRVEGPSGAPVALFLHPFPLHADAWEEMLVACAASGLCAAALDAPGFGGTPPLGSTLQMDYLADLAACALDALGAKRAAIAGCSMGGYAAMAFAKRHPERLSSLALLCTRANADAPEARSNRETQAALAQEKGAQAVTAGFVPKLVAPDADATVLARVGSLATRASAQGVADALRGMAARPDRTAELGQWKWPTLVIAGETDQLISRAESAALAAGIRGAKLHVLPKVGHLPMIETPRETAQLLVPHLQRHIHE